MKKFSIILFTVLLIVSLVSLIVTIQTFDSASSFFTAMLSGGSFILAMLICGDWSNDHYSGYNF